MGMRGGGGGVEVKHVYCDSESEKYSEKFKADVISDTILDNELIQ